MQFLLITFDLPWYIKCCRQTRLLLTVSKDIQFESNLSQNSNILIEINFVTENCKLCQYY